MYNDVAGAVEDAIMMTSGRQRSGFQYGHVPAVCMSLAMLLQSIGTAYGSPPLEPRSIPLFSLDSSSPSVDGGGADLTADGVLFSNVEQAGVRFSAYTMGLGMTGDDINGLSFNRAIVDETIPFMLLFSVSRETMGAVQPDPQLDRDGVVFNVADQAARGQQAGDGFASLVVINRQKSAKASLRGGSFNNVQIINNYDEGGSDFSANPPTSSREYSSTFQDNVSAVAYEPINTNGKKRMESAAIYYTLEPASESLRNSLPGNSAADIFIDPNPAEPGLVGLFAMHEELGLLPGDNIDAVVVFDVHATGSFGRFDEIGDQVIFSLAPNSPSIKMGLIPNASPNGAADIFSVRWVAPPDIPTIEVLVHAFELGLQDNPDTLDNIDALELLELEGCVDGNQCATEWGIRLVKGDWGTATFGNDGLVTLEDLPFFIDCMTGPTDTDGFPIPTIACQEVFDFFPEDGDIDLNDFAMFQKVFSYDAISGPS